VLTDAHRWGALLRSYRMERKLSQRALARRIVWSCSAVAMAETGGRPPSLEFAEACDKALDAGGRLLEEAKRIMHRRGLLVAVAAAPVFNVSDVAYRTLATALDGMPRTLDEWQERTEQYGRDYLALGPTEDLQTRLAHDLINLRPKQSDTRLWAVAAKLTSIKGKMTAIGSAGAGPADWYRLATVAADKSGDVDTQVWVRGRAALSLAHEAEEVAMAEQFAEHALGLSDQASAGRLNALVAKAQIAASRGDRETALTMLDESRRIFDLVGTDHVASDFNVPVWRFHTFASVVLSRLGDQRACADQDEADRTRPLEFARFATHIELHRGLLLARSGDVATGVSYAKAAAARLPEKQHSLSLRRMVREIMDTANSSCSR
jgi:transcriptional regulator with XRE-family HTH domain